MRREPFGLTIFMMGFLCLGEAGSANRAVDLQINLFSGGLKIHFQNLNFARQLIESSLPRLIQKAAASEHRSKPERRREQMDPPGE